MAHMGMNELKAFALNRQLQLTELRESGVNPDSYLIYDQIEDKYDAGPFNAEKWHQDKSRAVAMIREDLRTLLPENQGKPKEIDSLFANAHAVTLQEAIELYSSATEFQQHIQPQEVPYDEQQPHLTGSRSRRGAVYGPGPDMANVVNDGGKEEVDEKLAQLPQELGLNNQVTLFPDQDREPDHVPEVIDNSGNKDVDEKLAQQQQDAAGLKVAEKKRRDHVLLVDTIGGNNVDESVPQLHAPENRPNKIRKPFNGGLLIDTKGGPEDHDPDVVPYNNDSLQGEDDLSLSGQPDSDSDDTLIEEGQEPTAQF